MQKLNLFVFSIVLSVLVGVQSKAFASSSSSPSFDPISKDLAFNATLKLCMEPKLSKQLNFAYQGFNKGWDEMVTFPGIIPGIGENSIYLRQIWTNDGFEEGLTACYGDNEARKKIFRASLLYSDGLGQIAGMFAKWTLIFKAWHFGTEIIGMIPRIGNFLVKLVDLWMYFDIGRMVLWNLPKEIYYTVSYGINVEDADHDPRIKKLLEKVDNGQITKEQLQSEIRSLMLSDMMTAQQDWIDSTISQIEKDSAGDPEKAAKAAKLAEARKQAQEKLEALFAQNE
ncbi:MAG: hypothetical protein AB7F43_08255 [Bacteriovoracia bacterium]